MEGIKNAGNTFCKAKTAKTKIKIKKKKKEILLRWQESFLFFFSLFLSDFVTGKTVSLATHYTMCV